MRKRINPKERRRIPALIQIFGPLEDLGNCQTFLFCMIKGKYKSTKGNYMKMLQKFKSQILKNTLFKIKNTYIPRK